MRKKLPLYSEKADLMNISLTVGEEVFEFNLFNEVDIREDFINQEIINQPPSYSFLLMVRVKLKRSFEIRELQRKETYADLFLSYKEDKDPSTGKYYSKDTVENFVYCDKEYLKTERICIRAKHDLGTIEACIQAFEQRGNLIQTISANKRKEQ